MGNRQRVQKALARQRGQGMTEYIIIVALIALAAIGVYSAFGGVVRGQTAVMASQLAGTSATAARGNVTGSSTSANTEASSSAGLANYQDRGVGNGASVGGGGGGGGAPAP